MFDDGFFTNTNLSVISIVTLNLIIVTFFGIALLAWREQKKRKRLEARSKKRKVNYPGNSGEGETLNSEPGLIIGNFPDRLKNSPPKSNYTRVPKAKTSASRNKSQHGGRGR